MNDGVWEGVDSLLDAYVAIQPLDHVLVLYTSESFESAAWVSAALEIRGIDHHRVWMAPIHDDGLAERLAAALPSPDSLAGRLILLSFERDTMSHSAAIARALGAYPPSRIAIFRTISAGEALFAQAMRADPAELSARNTALLERLMVAERLRCTTRGGSDFQVRLDSTRHRWISNRGIARPGGTVILPAGEIATFPADLSGKHVADFAFNINAITERDARLDTTPVTVWFEGGRARDFACDDLSTRRFIEDCLTTHCASNVGELGFGTNPRIDRPVAMNSHINERRPGIHLGLGQHNQGSGVVPYQCAIHLDLIAAGGLVWVDDDPVPIDLEQVVPSPNAHPRDPRDEDVFSPEVLDVEGDDCCGRVSAEGLAVACAVPA